MLSLVLRFAEDDEEFLQQFDRLSVDLLRVMARRLPEQLTSVLNAYCAAIENEVGRYNFEYAEVVADKMRAIYRVADSSELKALALKATMIAAVQLNRYAAMEVFDTMLVAVENDDDAVAIAEMLRDEADYYKALASHVSKTRLHVVIRAVYEELENDSQDIW